MKLTSLLFLVLFTAASIADDNVSPYPLFHYDIVSYAAKDDLSIGRIEIFIEVVYDDVQFVKVDESYKADYEISAVITDGGDQIDGDIWKESLSVSSFDETNSRSAVSLSNKSFRLEPGKYTVSLKFEDLESGKTYSSEDKIKIDDYSVPPISASEIAFARQVTVENGVIKSIVPEVTTSYKGLGYPAFAYIEIYNPQMAETAELTVEIQGENTGFKSTKTTNIALTGERSGYSFALPTDSLLHDRYLLKIDIVANGKKAELEKTFYVRWNGLPRNASDLDEAILQVHYIATREEWKKLKKVPESKKLEYFQEFWKKRDPTSGTEENEAMQSYYAKIDAANQLFTVVGRKGWQTDRGLVFIILGPPDEIIQNNYPSGSRPYHIWQYYSINRQFEFYDRNGFGDFEFLNPLSIGELQRFAVKLQ